MPGAAFLRGESVALRTVETEDAERLREIVNDPEVRRYLLNRTPINVAAEREWIEENAGGDENVHLLVCVGEGRADLAGMISFGPAASVDGSAELGLSLAPEHWGRGYGTEAARLLTTHAFAERRLHRMVAKVIDGNAGSARIWEKLGFRREARLTEAAFQEGEYADVLVYAVLDREWEHY